MTRKTSKKLIKKIREEVLNGKSKYSVAKELNISEKIVYYNTRDLPSKNPGRTEIRGRTLKVLKTLLTEGYVESNKKNLSNLRTLGKHFKVIKKSRVNGKKIVYYLEDKNKKALKEIIRNQDSKVISYHELSNLSQIFQVELSSKEKKESLNK